MILTQENCSSLVCDFNMPNSNYHYHMHKITSKEELRKLCETIRCVLHIRDVFYKGTDNDSSVFDRGYFVGCIKQFTSNCDYYCIYPLNQFIARLNEQKIEYEIDIQIIQEAIELCEDYTHA